jgi:AmmeMemoRadiSam system protein B
LKEEKMVRYPAVAGQFYPDSPSELTGFLKSVCVGENNVDAKAIIVPHAGYIFSGKTAGAVYGKIKVPPVVAIFGPNHTGFGPAVSVYPGGKWLTPLGEVPVNEEITKELVKYEPFELDTTSHLYEHSLEVQLPFLQFVANQEFSIVPVVFSVISYQTCKKCAEVLNDVLPEDSLLVISTDFSHYVSQSTAKELDGIAISSILELSPEKLYERVFSLNISMCGVIPSTVGLIVAKERGANKAELVDYSTSGDVTGDYGQVVGYAGIIIY